MAGNIKVKKNKVPKRKAWDQDVERLVLYVDIMGFTHRVNSQNHVEVKKTLIEFEAEWQKRIMNLHIGDCLRFSQFSDSIILVSNGTDYRMFNLITKAAVSLMQVSMKMGIPIKCVLAQGVFSFETNPNLCFGRPLVDAYLLHDEVYYYGIVVHHTAETTIKDFSNDDNPYYKTPTPMKKGRTTHYHLAWNLLKNLGVGSITDDVHMQLNEIEETVSGGPRVFIDNTRAMLDTDYKIWKENRKLLKDVIR